MLMYADVCEALVKGPEASWHLHTLQVLLSKESVRAVGSAYADIC
jgi:hypothetical protein